MHCQRCNGRMERGGDRWGGFWSCICCGAEVNDAAPRPKQRRKKQAPFCECGAPARARSMCMHHYNLWRWAAKQAEKARVREPSHAGRSL